MRRHKDPSRRQPKPSRRKTPSRRQPKPGRQPKRKTTQAQKTPATPTAATTATSTGALHPLRGGAPEQKRCIAYGSGAAPQHTRTNAELAHRTTRRRTPPCAAGPYWWQDGHAAHAATCTPAHSDTSYTLTCEEPDNLRSVRVGDISIDNPQGWYYLFPGSYRIEATPKNPAYWTINYEHPRFTCTIDFAYDGATPTMECALDK